MKFRHLGRLKARLFLTQFVARNTNSHVSARMRTPRPSAKAYIPPKFIRPCIPTTAKANPQGDAWLHEPKLERPSTDELRAAIAISAVATPRNLRRLFHQDQGTPHEPEGAWTDRSRSPRLLLATKPPAVGSARAGGSRAGNPLLKGCLRHADCGDGDEKERGRRDHRPNARTAPRFQ